MGSLSDIAILEALGICCILGVTTYLTGKLCFWSNGRLSAEANAIGLGKKVLSTYRKKGHDIERSIGHFDEG